MEWTELTVTVHCMAVDPGIVHHSNAKTVVEREQLKVGEHVHYDDPSGIMAGLTVTEMDDAEAGADEDDYEEDDGRYDAWA